jgi:hypothetical protein
MYAATTMDAGMYALLSLLQVPSPMYLFLYTFAYVPSPIYFLSYKLSSPCLTFITNDLTFIYNHESALIPYGNIHTWFTAPPDIR